VSRDVVNVDQAAVWNREAHLSFSHRVQIVGACSIWSLPTELSFWLLGVETRLRIQPLPSTR
jgi:hypothetical protein